MSITRGFRPLLIRLLVPVYVEPDMFVGAANVKPWVKLTSRAFIYTHVHSQRSLLFTKNTDTQTPICKTSFKMKHPPPLQTTASTQ